MQPKELLKYLTPFELEFKLKIFSNRNGHDFAILLKATGDEAFIEDPRDLESFITQLRAARKQENKEEQEPMTFEFSKKRYEGEIYTCIFIDFKKKQES